VLRAVAGKKSIVFVFEPVVVVVARLLWRFSVPIFSAKVLRNALTVLLVSLITHFKHLTLVL
jgi:hypothetical protein